MRNLSVIKGVYQGNGTNRNWTIPFEYNDTSQICVTLTTYADGDYTYQEISSSDFTINTGSQVVVYPKSGEGDPISSNQYVAVWRNTDLLQLTDLTNQGAAWPDTIEASLDKLHQIVQELAEGLSRTLKVDIGDPETPEQKLLDLQTYVANAADSAAASAASATESANSASSAAQSATNAANSATAAANSATAAANSAATAEARIVQAAATLTSNFNNQINEAVAGVLADAQESADEAEGWASVATANANLAQQAALSAKAYSAPAYDSNRTYQAGEVVSYIDGNSYRAIAETTGNDPTNTTYWTKITAYVGDDYWMMDAAGYIVPNPAPTYSGRWVYDTDGYLVPINNQVA